MWGKETRSRIFQEGLKSFPVKLFQAELRFFLRAVDGKFDVFQAVWQCVWRYRPDGIVAALVHHHGHLHFVF